MKNEKKCDCENCIYREMFDKVFEPEIKNRTRGFVFDGGCDEEYERHHMCGLCEHIERCNIPGHRTFDKWFTYDDCILNFLEQNKDNEWPLPLYTGKYEDLLNIN